MIKPKAFAKLSEIKEKNGIDVTKQMLALASSEDVPDEVVDFIERFSAATNLDSDFRTVLKDKMLYKTLKKSDDPNELAKALCSLFIHVLVEYKNNPESIETIRAAIDFEYIADSLLYYLSDLDSRSIKEASEYALDLIDCN